MLMRRILPLLAMLLLAQSCGSDRNPSSPSPLPVADLPPVSAGPAALPADGIQPWERLDDNGHIAPARRAVSAINGNTDYSPGVERFLSAGDVQPNGEALRLNGSGGNDPAYAMFRVSLQDQQPGIVSVDANLLAAGSEYYVGISNYAGVRWEWSGPFSDPSIRLPVVTDGNGDYTSGLGNTFVTVLAERGNPLDLVGVGVNQYDPADSIVPPAPAGFSLTPVNGGLELAWSPVLVNDLAGYIIYYSASDFVNPGSAGVVRLPTLEGSTRLVLSGLVERTYIAVSALDFGGNESPVSEVLSDQPLTGESLPLVLETDKVSERRDGIVSLTASGAANYDWDLDGDGIFEVTDDSSGSQQAFTGQAGVLRPRVRGRDAAGEAVALGSITVLITGNTRPVASATADPQSGPPPLQVSFTGTADDLEDEPSALEYAWDFNGDGIFENGTDSLTPSPQDYLVPGTWNARFRVSDSEGAWDVDSVAITVGEGLGGFPTAELSVSPLRSEKNTPFSFDAAASVDPGGSINNYEWDIDDNGIFNESGNGEEDLEGQASVSLSWAESGLNEVSVRVTDADNNTAIASVTATVAGWRITNLMTPEDVVTESVLIEVAGHPAVFYYDNDDDDLMFIRALDPLGSAWGSPVLVDVNSYIRGKHSAIIVSGRPALAYSGVGGPGLKYVRAQNVTGSSWGTPMVLDATSGSTTSVWADHVAGNPAIAYYDSTTDSLRYIRATNSSGSSWGGFITVDSSDDPGLGCSLAIVNGNPAISYQLFSGKDLAYIRATDVTGSSWGSRRILDTTNDTGVSSTLVVVQGAPAIAYQNSSISELRYIRAADADGENWGDKTIVDDNGSTGWTPFMGMFDGLPLICYRSITASSLMVITAADVGGTTWGEPFEVDLENNVGSAPSMISLDGRPAISYYDSDSQPNGDFRFAVRY